MKRTLGTRLLSLAVAGALALALPLGVFADTYDLSKGDITVTVEKRKDENGNETGEEDVWVKQTSQNETDPTKEDAYLSEDATKELNLTDGTEKQAKVPETAAGDSDLKVIEGVEDTDTEKVKQEKEAKEKEAIEKSEEKGSATRVYDTVKGLLQKTAVKIKQSEDTTDNTITVKAEENTTADVTVESVNIRSDTDAAIKVDAEKGATVKLELDGESTVKSGAGHAGIEKNGTAAETGTLVIKDEDNNGKITATGSGQNSVGGGAGIGGAANNTGANITITGGDVTANGASWGGAGIGGGGNENTEQSDATYADGENIIITGGKVTANGGARAAGIGGARAGNGKDILITGGKVTANGGQWGAGIGGGMLGYDTNIFNSMGGHGINITITGGNVKATGNTYGAGIGGGFGGDAENVAISGGIVVAEGGYMGAGIGSGAISGDADGNNRETNATGINISGGDVTATGGAGAAGIGGGYAGNGKNISISGGKITATTSSHGAGIGGGGGIYDNKSGKYLGGNGENIAISGGEITATGNTYGAGIGGGYNGNGENITVSGGVIEATGGDDGAGIGGGCYGAGNNITISGGTTRATGGYAAAGIGGGTNGAGANITVSGGTTTATGDYGSAGIGGGFGGNAANLTVSGGTATATGGDYGSGVGSGYAGTSGDITISGGVLTAIAGTNAAAVGGGSKGITNGVIRVLNRAKVLLGEADTGAAGYIGSGRYAVDAKDGSYKAGEPLADGENARYIVDCTATITGIDQPAADDVETTYRPDMTTSEWLWDNIAKYIHYTPGAITGEVGRYGKGTYTNGTLTINCEGHPEDENGLIWYWATLPDGTPLACEERFEGGTLTLQTAEPDAVLHVLLSGWQDHPEVERFAFATAGRSTTLDAAQILAAAAGEHLTLTHEDEAAALAVDDAAYPALIV